MWSEGTIGIPDAKDKDRYTVCHYWVKHYDEPSETYGIITANYDRGWDVEPQDEPTRMAYSILLYQYN